MKFDNLFYSGISSILLLIFFILSGGTAMAQCPETAEITTNAKCARLNWVTPPVPYPGIVMILGETYNVADSTANSATYTNDGSPNANGCNNFGVFTGDITIGSNICSYVDGGLTGTSPLPVSLINLNAMFREGQAHIAWSTASEINNEGFEIEESRDGVRWSDLGWINGHGTTNELHTYQMIDKDIQPGYNYYRLKQVDYDGFYSYSKVVYVHFEQEGYQNLMITPNPANHYVTLSNLDLEYDQQVAIFNQLGKQVLEMPLLDSTIDISSLKEGIYYLTVFTNGRKITKKLIVR